MATKSKNCSIIKQMANNLPDAVKAAIKGLRDIEPVYKFISQYRGSIPIARLLDPELLD